MREYKQLLDENIRLKKLVAELSLDKAILQDINQLKKMARPALKRKAVQYAVAHFTIPRRRPAGSCASIEASAYIARG